MLIRREDSRDADAVGAVHAAAFRDGEEMPVEVRLVESLRASSAWIEQLSLVAESETEEIVGHVVCSRGYIGGAPVLALGPLGVVPERQASGVGSALMHAVVGAADALDEPVICLLGHVDYYRRFGFVPAAQHGIDAPDPSWGDHFQARLLTACQQGLRGAFRYPAPFDEL